MTGECLKKKLFSCGYRINELATMLDMSQQNVSRALAVADVKTGLLEKICAVIGKDMSFFYGYKPIVSEPQQGESVPFSVYKELLNRFESIVRENQILIDRLAAYEPQVEKKVAKS